MMKPLTARQREVLDYLISAQSKGPSPTIREMCDALGMSSPNGMMCHLKALAKKGYIELPPGKARSIKILEDAGKTQTIWGRF